MRAALATRCRRGLRPACVAALSLAAACGREVAPSEPPLVRPIDVELRQTLQAWGVARILPPPSQNVAQVALGRALFFDKILSGNRDVSCATCHHPTTHGADGLSLAIGTGGSGHGAARTPGPGRQPLPRNAPSLLNQGLGSPYMFWDGRLASFGPGHAITPAGVTLPGGLPNLLAAQAVLPMLNREEMRGLAGDRDRAGAPNELAQFGDGEHDQIWRAVMRRLLAIPEYVALFESAFPGTPRSQLGIQHAATAIAAFETQAFTKSDTPFDRYLARQDAALSAPEKRGALLFFGKALCASCHSGPLLGAFTFANVGTPQIGPGLGRRAPLDLGRGETAGFQGYEFVFRAPPLRNVELTAPYMHDGAYATLEAVVRHYNDVPTALREYDVAQLAPSLRASHHGDAATIDAILATLDHRLRQPLRLSDEEMRDIVAFLRSLTDPAARTLSALVPTSVPSGLPVQE